MIFKRHIITVSDNYLITVNQKFVIFYNRFLKKASQYSYSSINLINMVKFEYQMNKLTIVNIKIHILVSGYLSLIRSVEILDQFYEFYLGTHIYRIFVVLNIIHIFYIVLNIKEILNEINK